MDVKNITIPSVALNDGSTMPQLGFGTWTLRDEVASNSVRTAIELGYRLIDTAQMYQNEEAVGKGIAQSGIDRSELCVVTKVNTGSMREHTVRESIEGSLKALGTGYIDQLLIHWPVPGEVKQTWQIMEEFVDKGLVRSLGCSNFLPEHLEDLFSYARIRPVVNQIEFHPYMQQQELADYSTRAGLQVEAWGPYGQGMIRVTDDPEIAVIAARYGRTPSQIILRWHMQRGLVTIPRSTSRAHMAENMDIFGFSLAEADMAAINALHRSLRSDERNDPKNFPW